MSDDKPCSCWYGPPILHADHCCFREPLVETLFGRPECACGHFVDVDSISFKSYDSTNLDERVGA